MGEKSAIEWTTGTWPIVVGCTEDGPECQNCYAVYGANRMGSNPNPKMKEAYQGLTTRKGSLNKLHWNGTVRCLWNRLDWPSKRFKPGDKIFVTSMGDLHHDDVPLDFLLAVYKEMEANPDKTFQVLTKRPQNMRRFINEEAPKFHQWRQWPLPNVWAGTTVGTPNGYRRVYELIKVKAAYHFLSCEPLLAPLELDKLPCPYGPHSKADPYCSLCCNDYIKELFGYITPLSDGQIDLVICGGESGPYARPMHPDWARSLRDQCQAAGTSFFFKQWGEWMPKLQYSGDKSAAQCGWGVLNRSGKFFLSTTPWNGRQGDPRDDYEYLMLDVGKKEAGRLLDGQLWDEMPEIRRRLVV